MTFDTQMDTPSENIYFDTSEKILALSDRLAEDIILENIETQLEGTLEPLTARINYISLFREKYANIKPEDDVYDEEYMKQSLANVAAVVADGIKEKYGVELGTDLDYETPDVYLKDMETLYEFLFIRHFTNLVDYFNHQILSNKDRYLELYSKDMEDDKHAKDIFVQQSRKRFKNKDDVTILHFLNEIIRDIQERTTSAYDLFMEIADLDKYEEYNNRMLELLINYGNKIVLNQDAYSALLYMAPLESGEIFSELRNAIWSKYIERCEFNENYN